MAEPRLPTRPTEPKTEASITDPYEYDCILCGNCLLPNDAWIHPKGSESLSQWEFQKNCNTCSKPLEAKGNITLKKLGLVAAGEFTGQKTGDRHHIKSVFDGELPAGANTAKYVWKQLRIPFPLNFTVLARGIELADMYGLLSNRSKDFKEKVKTECDHGLEALEQVWLNDGDKGP